MLSPCFHDTWLIVSGDSNRSGRTAKVIGVMGHNSSNQADFIPHMSTTIIEQILHDFIPQNSTLQIT